MRRAIPGQVCPMSKMNVTVIIPSHRRPLDLRRCLNGIKLQARKANEILVVARPDDAETLETISEWSHELAGLRCVRVDEPGLVAALNRGLDCATGDILVLTDDDSEAYPDWLESIEAIFQRDAKIGAVGGRDWIQLPLEPSLFDPPTVRRIGCLSWSGKMNGNHHCRLEGHTQKVQFLKGVNLAMRRQALDSCRIDTSLRGSGAQWGSEIDLCSQLRKKGFDIVFDDRILVKHYGSPRPDSDNRKDSRVMSPNLRFNRHYLVAKHFNLYLSLMHLWSDLLLGRRPAPGLLSCIKWSLKGDRGVAWDLFKQTPVVFAGFASGRRARAAGKRAGAGGD